MRNIILIFTIIYLMLSVFWKLKSQEDEIKRLEDNAAVLMSDAERYRLSDSTNVVKNGVLSLKLSEFQEMRKNDAALIKKLRIRNSELQSLAATQTKTIKKLQCNVRDSIVIINNVVDTLRCIDITEKWFDLHGCSNSKDQFTGYFENRDSLVIAVETKYKRFLGFLWKTKKIKKRNVIVTSKNQDTKILGVDFIEIKK